jgi:DNA topoisomerase I
MNLIIVESPTKAKTLAKFLGDKYHVKATYGHVRDLPERKLGVDVRNGFAPDYVVVPKQKDRIKELETAAHTASDVFLATDPDREGEAIAFHVAELLKGDGADKNGNYKRIEFHEITESAVWDALSHPRMIDMKLVEAQQARRILDRLVGYKLSPLLWKKVRKGLSAGRVQSVAVRLIVEKEREIEAFKPEEYWNIRVEVTKDQGGKFRVQFVSKNGEKTKVVTGDEAGVIDRELRAGNYRVASVEKRDIKKTPSAPFTTSTLQQAAANRLGWSAKKTMQVAQMLYEEGYITYHRTDSTNLAVEAVRMAGEYVADTYGREYALDVPRIYKTKSKVAQEAHEAIRPTKVQLLASELAGAANRDQEKLYDLIWKRFLACQMAEARGEAKTVEVECATGNNKYGLTAKGETITFDGWLKLFGVKESGDENPEAPNGESDELPELTEGEHVNFADLTSEQKFTQPPARYNDASLIKALEERGIGRPSTYAPILSTIQDRQYVERLDKRFKPTALGIAVNDFLVKNFPKIVDYNFTAKMEDDLDNIANGELTWKPTISDFYGPFEKDLEQVAEVAERVKVEVETTGEKCPVCKEGDVVIRIGRFGKFLACSRYPECGYKANYMEKIGVKCPKCGGDVILRRTKSRKSFYGCSNYPKCDYASWTKPKAETKPEDAPPVEAVVK